MKLTADPSVISLAGGMPGSECFPVDQIRAITEDILASGRAARTLQYGVTTGYNSTREAVRGYIKDIGVDTESIENILIVSGGQQGLDLMCKAFLNKGDVVLVEDPTYLAFLQIVAGYEAVPVGVRSNPDGLDIGDLEAKIKRYKPKLLYVVPNFSNPTGKTYTAQNRQKIAETTAKYGVVIIEDDPYGRLRYEGEDVAPLYTFCGGNCVYVSSFSKVISPGIRLGFCTGPKEIIRKLEIGKQGSDVHSSHMSQLIAEQFITRGLFPTHLNYIKSVYRAKKDVMVAALDKYMPAKFKYEKAQGGLFIWGGFDEAAGIDTVELFPRAVEHKVAYVYGNVFYADGSGRNMLRLNFSQPTCENLEKGVKALGGMFNSAAAYKA